MGKKGKQIDAVTENPQSSSTSGGRSAGSSSGPSLAKLLDYGAEHLEYTLEELVPAQPHFLMLCDGLLSPSECMKIITAMEEGYHGAIDVKAPNLADLKPKKNEALLNRDSAALVDPEMCEKLWQRLSPILPTIDDGKRTPVGLVGDGRMGHAIPNQLKLYRYQKGHSFGLHVDVSRKGERKGDETEYTLLIYLNSQSEAVSKYCDHPLVGGDTIFMATAKQELCRISPKQGSALLHAHGRRCLLHEGELVSKGVKYVLRADVMYSSSSPQHGGGE